MRPSVIGGVALDAAGFAEQRERSLYGTNRAADRQTDTATDTVPNNKGRLQLAAS